MAVEKVKNNYPEEAFISFLWLHQKFDSTKLQTLRGEELRIVKNGHLNEDSGPDFREASILLNDIQWSGCVELHVKSSEWYQHGHQNDSLYENVILHVVWENDLDVVRKDGTSIPVLELKSITDPALTNRYKELIKAISDIPCSGAINKIDELHIKSQLHKAAIERIKIKSEVIKVSLNETRHNWEEAAYIFLASSFGFNLNKNPFLSLAQSLPYKHILQNKDNLFRIEALLFGMSSIINDKIKDPYAKKLLREFRYQSTKYGLTPVLSGLEWKFMRTRPDNFPTIRIAQLAGFLSSRSNIFSGILECRSIRELKALFDFPISDYWSKHYMFGKERKKPVYRLGYDSIVKLAINAVVPLKVAYGIELDDHRYIESGIILMESLPAEDNKFTRKMIKNGFKISGALESQAAIHQYRHYCSARKCLSCEIGFQLLKN